MKTMRVINSQTVLKDIEPKDKAKGSIEGGRKTTSQVPTFDTSIPQQDFMIFNCHHIR